MHRRPHCTVVEMLEARQLLSTYYVATDGDDARDGSEAHPWRTIQKAADSVVAGDLVKIGPGEYAGFSVGQRRPARGTSAAPIVFDGLTVVDESSFELARILSTNATTDDGIYVAPGSSHVTIRGFQIGGGPGPMRGGIRVKQAAHVTLHRNSIYGDGAYGISAVRADDLTLAKNEVRYSWTRGISVVGGRDAVIHRNSVVASRLNPRFRFGIDLQADPVSDTFVLNAVVRGNRIEAGASSGVAIRAAGVRDGRFYNNLLAENRGHGIMLTAAPGVGPSRDNVIVNNTVDHLGYEGWALSLVERTTGTTVLNNILINRKGATGSVLIAPDSLPGLSIDYNIYENQFSADAGGSVIGLDAWRNVVGGQDAHSFLATPRQLFLHESSAYWVHGRSPAVDAGTSRHAPPEDMWGRDRIGLTDIGATEAGYPDSFTRYRPDEGGQFDGVVLGDDFLGYPRLTPTFRDDFETSLGPDWEILPWYSDDDGVANISGLDSYTSLSISGALVRSIATVSDAVEAWIDTDGYDDAVTTAPTRVFGIGNDFGPAAGNYWAAFVSRGANNVLYAELNLGGTIQRVNLDTRGRDYGLTHSGDFQSIFRIEPTASGFRFYRENRLVATIDGLFPDTVEPKILMGSHHESPATNVRHVEAGPYTSGGTYTSPVHDERASGAWGTLELPLAQQLHGTSLLFETRTGETATPDASWSDWQPLGADDMIQSPEGRYIQVRVTFLTTTPQRTPVLYGYMIETRPAA